MISSAQDIITSTSFRKLYMNFNGSRDQPRTQGLFVLMLSMGLGTLLRASLVARWIVLCDEVRWWAIFILRYYSSILFERVSSSLQMTYH